MKYTIILTIVFLAVANGAVYSSFFNKSSDMPKIQNIEFGEVVNNSRVVKVYVEGDIEKKSQFTMLYRRQGWRNWNEAVEFRRFAYDTLNTKQGSVITENWFLGRLFYLHPNSSYEARLSLKFGDSVVVDTLINFYTSNIDPRNQLYHANEIFVSSNQELKNAIKNIGNFGVISLAPGVYNGSFILNNVLTHNSQLVIKAQEFGTVIIEPDTAQRGTIFTINSSSNLRFENLIFRNASVGFSLKNSNSVEIFNCVFEQVKNPVIAENGRNIIVNNSHFDYRGQSDLPDDSKSVAITLKNSPLSAVSFSSFVGFSRGVVIEGVWGEIDDFFISNNSFCQMGEYTIFVENIWGSGVIKSNKFTNGALAIKLADISKGPLYIFRNVVLNYENGVAIYGYSRGIEIYHNNFFTTSSVVLGEAKWSYSKIMNNVFLPTGGYSFYSGSFLNNSVISHNAFDLSRHFFVKWSLDKGKSYVEYRQPRDAFFATGYFYGSIGTSYNEFNNVPFPNVLEGDCQKNLDWYPLRHSALVNGGKLISGINGGFYNSAPDIGAQEYGDSLEVFGPRVFETNVTVVSDDDEKIIENISVFPNPFNSATNLNFRLNQNSQLSIEIYDIAGRIVKEVYSGEASFGEVSNIISFFDVDVPSGIYFIKIQAGKSVHKVRICYVK